MVVNVVVCSVDVVDDIVGVAAVFVNNVGGIGPQQPLNEKKTILVSYMLFVFWIKRK